MSAFLPLEATLRVRRDSGRKLLVPYVTAGVRADWIEILQALSAADVDAIEIGIPFSDPVMDGPVIQEASVQALERGTTPSSALNDVRAAEIGVPLAVMTYYNLVFRFGFERMAKEFADAGISGMILPDMPLEEAGKWLPAAESADIETVLLVAPNTPDERMKMICDRAKGFVYGIGTLGVTGERTNLAASAIEVGKRVKQMTDKPVLIGVGVSTPTQARQAAASADGVIIGSALVRRILEGDTPEQLATFIGEFRQALDTPQTEHG